MGRQGPRLVPFLQSALSDRKYRNLISEDPSGLIFSIVLPHKTKKLDAEDELIFKDWYALNGKKYVFASKHYTDAKQAMTASLRKSDYVEKVHISDDKIIYRILNKSEVKEKKRLKKQLKKKNQIKEEMSENDEVFSSVESGYGSGGDSPRNDYALMSSNDNFIFAVNDSSQSFNLLEGKSLFEINDVLQSTYSDVLEGVLKPEPMDTSISADISLAVSDTPILLEPDFLPKILSFPDNLKPADYFPENSEHSSHSLDLTEEFSLENPEFTTSGLNDDFHAENGYDFLQLDGLNDEEINNLLLKDVSTFNFGTPLAYEESINREISETQNVHVQPLETEDVLTEKLWEKLMEEISAINFNPSMPFEKSNQEKDSSTIDAGLPECETKENEKFYFCKKCVHLGKIPILFCEPQFDGSITETSGEIKIAFGETVLKEINGFKSVKEFKFINDHLMVILEPNDD